MPQKLSILPTHMKLGHSFRVVSLVLLATVSAGGRRLCESHFGGTLLSSDSQLCWGPASVKNSLQPVCPSEEGTVKSHIGQGLHQKGYLVSWCFQPSQPQRNHKAEGDFHTEIYSSKDQ